MAANSRLMTQLPIVDALDRPARPSDTMWVRATDGPLDTLVASSNLGLLGFETPAVIALAYWTGSNIASRSQTGSKADQGQHEIARPLRRERVNSSAGSKISRTAQIIRLARTGHQTTVTSRLSH